MKPPGDDGAAAPPSPFPSHDAIRRFVRQAKGRVGKREISQAFGLGAPHRKALRAVLRELEASGDIAPAGHRRFTGGSRAKRTGTLPEVTVVHVTGTDPDGDPIARPADWGGDGPPPVVFMAAERRGQPALAPGQRVLARLRPIGPGKYEGRTIKRLAGEPGRVLGVIRRDDQGQLRITPTDRRQKAEWLVPSHAAEGAEPGDIVQAEPLPGPALGLKSARVLERLGRMGDARAVSLICIHTHDIPQDFPPDALAEAEAARNVALDGRTDLRALPLVTIDGSDARDFDDAVFAEPAGDGWRLVVAIADVAHFVRAGSALDRAARQRGNSVYFPDRVAPMLPEALSNGLCSLRPNEDRGCVFVEIDIDRAGRKTAHRFGRGLMRSAARLTYEQAQDAAGDIVGTGGEAVNPALPMIPPLFGAYRALLAARIARGTLDLDLPERQVVLNAAGQVSSVAPRARLDSHRLIEEFMVLANVCAAETLEARRRPCMYRVHAPPSDDKLETLRTFLHGLDIALPAANQLQSRDLDRVLRQVAGTDHAPLVNEVMLRSQSQAAYAPDNLGHFGLALPRYAHFTSPIRRYADLLVHRALLRDLSPDDGALRDEDATEFTEVAEHITRTERRAALAERDAVDRYLAMFMAERIGALFDARISGVTRFGLFVTLPHSGANGLVPLSSLPDDDWMHDEAAQTLTSRRSRLVFRLAQPVIVRLRDAAPLTGGLLFEIAPESLPVAPVRRRGRG